MVVGVDYGSTRAHARNFQRVSLEQSSQRNNCLDGLAN